MENLSPKQLRCLALLAAGYTHKQAAEECGVSIRAIEDWKSKPEFRRMLRDAVGRVFDQAIARLILHAESAADQLCRIIEDEEISEKSRLTAISLLFTHASKAREWELQHRLEELEMRTLNGTDAQQATEP